MPNDISLTLALSKGRILQETLPFLTKAGVHPLESPDTSRKLLLPTNHPSLRILMVRASDTPTYVRYGAADFGVAGKDVLLESESGDGSGFYQPLDLAIARCRMVVAAPKAFPYEQWVRRGARLRIATKYVHTARNHFAAKGMHVTLIKLYGSMELAPAAGLADAIVDLVSTGATLQANDLRVVEEIMPISARLIVNRSAMKLKRQAINDWLTIFTPSS